VQLVQSSMNYPKILEENMNVWLLMHILIEIWKGAMIHLGHIGTLAISPDKARKGVIYPPKTGIYALVGISERTFTR